MLVAVGAAPVEHMADFGFEVVVGVLGFPVAVDAPEGVAEGGVHDDAAAATALHGEFGFEGPAALAGGGAEEVEEGLADGGFAGDVVLAELGEGGVIWEYDNLINWHLVALNWLGPCLRAPREFQVGFNACRIILPAHFPSIL